MRSHVSMQPVAQYSTCPNKTRFASWPKCPTCTVCRYSRARHYERLQIHQFTVSRLLNIAAVAFTAREFCRIVRERDAAAWPLWYETAVSGPLAGFAKHLCRDEAAFLAALQHPWSNGPVEGHIHRLKLIKRSMYGRAKFDLLRLRVLNAA